MKYRKILSAILALLMIISLIPAAILAEGISAELKDDPTLCTVTFVDTWDHNDPIVISTIEVEAGHVLTEEDFPEPPHHDNIEPIWDTFPGAVITCDTIIQTVYLAADPLISREVTFVDGVTGEILGTATVWAIWWGTPIITADQFPEAPEHDGYTFTGWSIAAGSYIYEDNTTITALYEEISIIPGDIDGDGQLSMADATLAARMALNLIDHVPSADIDGNGVISMADATMIARMAINID